MKDIERRFFTNPVHFEKREDGEDENVIEGYAAVFNKDSEDFGGWTERIAPGAFDEVLQDDAVALFNHDSNFVLGRNGVNVTLEEDEFGLRYKVRLPDTTVAKDLRQLVKDGIIHQSSFAFTVREHEWAEPKTKGENYIRTIKKVKRLYDVSPVTRPAYPDATVGARSLEEITKVKKDSLTADLMDWKNKINKHK